MTVNLLHCLASLATAVSRTENVEEGVGEEITVLVAGVALQHVHVVTRHVHVLDHSRCSTSRGSVCTTAGVHVVTRHVHVLHVVVAQQSNSPSSPL